MKRILLTALALTGLLLALAAAALARSGDQTAASAAKKTTPITVKSGESRFGTVLFDGKGRALYAFTADSSKASKCFGACAAAWPPAYTGATPRAGGTVIGAKLGSIKRKGGRLQATYNGHPLYYYGGDGVGKILCQNVDEFGGTWLVLNGNGALVR